MEPSDPASMVDARSLRLAVFTDTYLPQVNGVSRTLDRLCSAVRARGGTVRVFTPSDPESRNDDDVVRFASAPFWAYKELRLAWPSTKLLRAELDDFRPTLIQVATPVGMGLAGRRYALENSIPLVSSYHTSYAAYARHYKLGAIIEPIWKFLRWFHNSTRRTYCPTQSIVDEVTARGFENTTVWSRGVDSQLFSPAHRSSSLRAVMGANDRTLVVTYVGRLAAEKGLDVAMEALRLALQQRPGRIVFSCVGDGPYANDVRHASPRASWIPGQLSGTKLSEAYASGDVFLFPSTTDTFGNVMLEAMASGMPVLGADVGPTRELVGENRGWLVAPGDAAAFAGVLVNLVDAQDDLFPKRRAALEFARRNNWDNVWNALFRDYLRVASSRSTA